MSYGYVTKNGILYIEHSKKQEKFVLWLYNKLKLIKAPSGIKEYIRIHPKTKKKYYSLRFFTKAVLEGFHNIWYKPYKDHLGIVRYKKNFQIIYIVFLMKPLFLFGILEMVPKELVQRALNLK